MTQPSFAPLLVASPPRNIAVFRALQLGDMLCAIPALRALRDACPDARITLVGLKWAESLLARYPRYLDGFIEFPGYPGMPERAADALAFPGFLAEVRSRRFDLAIQLHGDGRITNGLVRQFGTPVVTGFEPSPGSGHPAFMPWPTAGHEIHRLLALVRHLGATRIDDRLEFPLTQADDGELRQSGVAEGLVAGGYVCLHPGARALAKRWPPACFAAVGDRLYDEYGLTVVLTGSQYETDVTAAVKGAMRAPAIDAAAPISVGALAAVLRGARLLVSNDTGVAHIAAALRLPSVIIFRTAEIARWAPLDRAQHRVVQAPGDSGLSEVLREARALMKRPPRDSTIRAPALSPLRC